MVAIAVVVVAIIVIFQAAAKSAGHLAPNSGPFSGPAYTPPDVIYQTPQSPTGSSPSKLQYPGAGQKPSGIILDYGPGFVTFSTIAASEARGVDATGFVLFDMQVQDGQNTANWKMQGAQLDYILLISFNGQVRVMNPLVAQTFNTDMVGSGNSGSLVGPGMVAVGQDASSNPGAVIAPYPASSANWSPPLPAPSQSLNPNNSWYGSPQYQLSVYSGV